MFLRELQLTNFKNHEKKQFSFEKKVICFTGLNGAGKTNILDAIYLLCIGKSYFSSTDKQCANHEDDFYRIVSKIDTHEIVCTFQKGKRKKIVVDEIPYKKIAEHVGRFPVVIVSPDDNKLILGSSEERRKFIDIALSQANREYLSHLSRYQKVIAERNSLLKVNNDKTLNYNLLSIYDEQIVPLGNFIFQKRKEFIEEIIPLFNKHYNTIAKDKEIVGLKYKSQLLDEDFATLLKDGIQKDKILQRSNYGTHKDDIEFFIGDEKMKQFGSQGQQKTFLLALKLSLYDFLEERLQIQPLFLIDDLFDKLDAERGANLINFVNQSLGQVFITHTDSESLKGKMSDEFCHFFEV